MYLEVFRIQTEFMFVLLHDMALIAYEVVLQPYIRNISFWQIVSRPMRGTPYANTFVKKNTVILFYVGEYSRLIWHELLYLAGLDKPGMAAN